MLLLSIHGTISAVIERGEKEKYLELDKEDAQRLSVSICNVARHYPQMETSQKILDHIFLIQTAAFIYGPMAYLVYQRGQERKHKTNKVTDFQNAGYSP